jgi:hypothetical protein
MTVGDCPVTEVKVATPAASLMKNCWLRMTLKTQKMMPTK